MNNLSRHSFHFAALVALRLLVPVRVQADVTEAWVQRYSNSVSNSVDRAFKVLSDSAGDIIVTGTTDNGITGQDILCAIRQENGSLREKKIFNEPFCRVLAHDGVEGRRVGFHPRSIPEQSRHDEAGTINRVKMLG